MEKSDVGEFLREQGGDRGEGRSAGRSGSEGGGGSGESRKTRIVFPEWENEKIRRAVESFTEVELVRADSLEGACKKVREGEADALVAGIDYTSREVILACREGLGMTGRTFSGCFWMRRGEEEYIIADAAACKNPTVEQLTEIVIQSYETAKRLLGGSDLVGRSRAGEGIGGESEGDLAESLGGLSAPKVAMLSFSTAGSGGKDESIEKIRTVIDKVREIAPEIEIDGEMQLDTAIELEVRRKKFPDSLVAGRANVLICPDLNSGNILYKSMERFGGFVAAGPILQGFKFPASDLSRGSSQEDVELVIEAMVRLCR